ncbi:cobalamin-binding protein [Salipaludibacillus sp. CUR1]|nr:cobalamin-binding protein [Salipaludibacillus sp. CUR1]MCE7791956.1 cobalamin-binding protein [Salipaludibacillus sp. CUR1]
MRILSLCPSNTELAVYAGLEDSLAGVDDYSDWPSSIKELPRLGPDLSINVEKAAELKPDIILASETVPGMEKNIEALKEKGLPYITVPNPTSMREVGDILLWLGEQTGDREKGEEAFRKFNHFMDHYAELSRKVTERKTIYWEWWGKPVFTPGKRNWLTELSELAGGVNIYEDYDQASVQTDWADVLSRAPDVIAAIWVGVQQHKVKPEFIKKRPGWASMKAVTDDSLHILEEPYFCRPSPRLLIGLAQMAAILHPDIYPPYKDGFDPLLNV